MKHINLTRREYIIHICGLTLITITFSFLQLYEVYLRDPISILITIPIHFTIGYIASGSTFKILHHIRNHFPLYHQSLSRVLATILAWVLLMVVTVYMVFYTYDWLKIYNYELNPLRLKWCLAAGFLHNIINTIIFEALYIEKRWGDDVREKEALRQANLVSQFESLKAQVNPHFLFNCLNSLSSLITQDPSKAEDFVDEMSSVYRYLLRNNEQGLVSVETEIQYIRSYFHLQKTRFGDAIDLNIDVEDDCWKCLIPPLTLQMLLENAVKHNVLCKTSPLLIEITGKDGYLSVRNNIQLRSKQYIVSTQIGLANIASKYKLINQSDIMIYNDGKYFEVGLPLIRNTVVPTMIDAKHNSLMNSKGNI